MTGSWKFQTVMITLLFYSLGFRLGLYRLVRWGFYSAYHTDGENWKSQKFAPIFLRVSLVQAKNSGVSKLRAVNLGCQLNTVVRASELRKCIRSNYRVNMGQ